MVLCSLLQHPGEWSIEYAYTQNEIKYISEIDKIRYSLPNSPKEDIIKLQSRTEELERLKGEEQEMFIKSVDAIANILEKLLTNFKI